jgi:NADH-quinone oxidoreductase subunit L
MGLLFLTVVFPIIGFLILAFSRGRISENAAAVVGVGSIGLSALTALYAGLDFLHNVPEGGSYNQVLWTWMNVSGFAPQFALHLDGLSLTMLGVVTGVGFLIHLFASWYMRGEDGYERFFSYMNLFVASMLFLVLGDNLLFLYFGWEGVGLCSYLLIGFYYKDPANGAAARKAFIVTRIGDTFMAIGLFLLFKNLGTLNIQDAMNLAPRINEHTVFLICMLLLGGAVGKSAQLPLQTWLPDAMAGPTPVSALIHAATMVTAGVYLIARTHVLFDLSPLAQWYVGAVGAVTLLMAGFCALVQTDIKRVLAYSTMSQIGYMFLAEGAGAYQAAVFHLMTHAFFKALLFLTAGAIIIATHHEQDIMKMGGLRKTLKLEYWCFAIGSLALCALPLITAGYYSKDEILWDEYAAHHMDFFVAGLAGAFMTSLYTARLFFIVFHGKEQIHAHPGHGFAYAVPLVVLFILSTFIGGVFIHEPLSGILPANPGESGGEIKEKIAMASGAVAILGIGLAAALYLGERKFVTAVANSGPGKMLTAWWKNAFGFDWLYDLLFVKLFYFIVRTNAHDFVDGGIGLIPRLMRAGHDVLAITENGRLRWYAATVAAGAVVVLTVLVWP